MQLRSELFGAFHGEKVNVTLLVCYVDVVSVDEDVEDGPENVELVDMLGATVRKLAQRDRVGIVIHEVHFQVYDFTYQQNLVSADLMSGEEHVHLVDIVNDDLASVKAHHQVAVLRYRVSLLRVGLQHRRFFSVVVGLN